MPKWIGMSLFRSIPILKKLISILEGCLSYIQQNSAAENLKKATNFEEWERLSTILDDQNDALKWKLDPASDLYDYKLIEERLRQFRTARESKNIQLILFLLRTNLSRNIGGISNPELFSKTKSGTKKLIEDFNQEITNCIQFVTGYASSDDDDYNEAQDDKLLEYKLEYMIKVRQTFGLTALLLSGGATYGVIHIGVIYALHREKLLPKTICGSSAGAIIASVICFRTDDELNDIDNLREVAQFEPFQRSNNPETIWSVSERFFKRGYLFDVGYLRSSMKKLLGQMTFLEAYHRSRRVLNITISSGNTYEMPQLLNYITAPDVLIWSAVVASCSLPFLFEKATLYAKISPTGEVVEWNASPTRFMDGSLDNDLPMRKLTELFHVNHFIVCQVNPHIVPFLKSDEISLSSESMKIFTVTFTNFIRRELLHLIHLMSELGIARILLSKMKSIFSQKYDGNINILPRLNYRNLSRLFGNPSEELVKEYCLQGERATWAKLNSIKNLCAIELGLDKAVQDLRMQKISRYANASLVLSEQVSDYQRKFNTVNENQIMHRTSSSSPRRSTRTGSLTECSVGQYSGGAKSPISLYDFSDNFYVRSDEAISALDHKYGKKLSKFCSSNDPKRKLLNFSTS